MVASALSSLSLPPLRWPSTSRNQQRWGSNTPSSQPSSSTVNFVDSTQRPHSSCSPSPILYLFSSVNFSHLMSSLSFNHRHSRAYLEVNLSLIPTVHVYGIWVHWLLLWVCLVVLGCLVRALALGLICLWCWTWGLESNYIFNVGLDLLDFMLI